MAVGIRITEEVNRLLTEIKAERVQSNNPVQNKNMILTELVQKAHKRECKK